MYIPFNLLPPTARLWVYAATRPLSENEISFINATAPEFLGSWATHGTPLETSYMLIDGQFLVLAVDEGVQAASGCSIDSSMGYVRMLETELKLSLTDRSLVYFKAEGETRAYELPQIKEAVAKGEITADTLLINTLVASKAELEQKWLVPAGDSWLKRQLKKAPTV